MYMVVMLILIPHVVIIKHAHLIMIYKFGIILWGVKGDALLTFAASTWGLVLVKAVRSASSSGFVVGSKHDICCV